MKSHRILYSKFSFICQNYNQNLRIKTSNQAGNSVVGKEINRVADVSVDNNLFFEERFIFLNYSLVFDI